MTTPSPSTVLLGPSVRARGDDLLRTPTSCPRGETISSIVPRRLEAFGGDGDDALVGHRFDDRLFGGQGDDRAHGGDGLDRCVAETRLNCEF